MFPFEADTCQHGLGAIDAQQFTAGENITFPTNVAMYSLGSENLFFCYLSFYYKSNYPGE